MIFLLPFLAITGFDTLVIDSGGDEDVGVSGGGFSGGGIFGDQEEVGEGIDSGGGAGLEEDFSLNPTEFNINLIINTNVRKTISITNLKYSPITLSIEQIGLDNMMILSEESITLGSRASKNFDVIFVALEDTGVFTGKIKVGDKEILVILNVKSKLLLFDSNIVILNKNYLVKQGDKLRTEVTLIPLGDKERLDVTLNYVIKDFNDKVFLTKSETLLIEDKKTFGLNFDTGLLPLGDYVIALELIYPNGVATSSASFKIVERTPLFLGDIVYYIVVSILINLILIVTLLISRVYQSE